MRGWVKGPAQTCRSLYRLQLPRLILDFPEFDVRYSSSPMGFCSSVFPSMQFSLQVAIAFIYMGLMCCAPLRISK